MHVLALDCVTCVCPAPEIDNALVHTDTHTHGGEVVYNNYAANGRELHTTRMHVFGRRTRKHERCMTVIMCKLLGVDFAVFRKSACTRAPHK